MLRRHLLAVPCLLLALAAHAAPTVGQPAPDFTLRDTAGRQVRLSDLRGKYVVLEWTNPGCPYVRKHYDSGNLPATQRDATGQGVVWLAINSTEQASSDWLAPADLAAWLQQRQARPTAVLLDPEGSVGRSYGARVTPHLYIIDPQGRLAYAGGIDSIASSNPADIAKAVNYVRQGLGEALSGRPISAATTRAYGCSIKYKS